MPPRPLLAAALALTLAGCSQADSAPAPEPPQPPPSPVPAATAVANPTAAQDTPKTEEKAKSEAVDPVRAAAEKLQAGKTDEAIEALEGLLKDKPDHRVGLLMMIFATQQKAGALSTTDRKGSSKVFYKSADAARKLREAADGNLNPREAQLVAQALYNEACSLALEDKGDEAMKSLKASFDAGFEDMDTFEHDAELDSLRKRPDYLEMIKGFETKNAEKEAKAAEEAKAEVATMMKEFKSFPFTFSLTDVDGKPIKSDDLKGKVAIVDIWGTWCPPCRKEIPELVKLYEKYHDQGFEIVGLNYNEDGTPDEVKKTIKDFMAENKMPYRCAVGDEKTQDQVPDFEGYPTTLFLDREGKVRLKMVGYAPSEKPKLEAAIKALLDEKKD